FAASSESFNTELWISDGTENGTTLLKEINPNGSSFPSNLTLFDNKIFFSARDENNDTELWVTDGTENGTMRFKDINTQISSPNIDNLTAVGDNLFFTASDENDDHELWISDGTESGTMRVKDIRTNGSSVPDHLVAVGNKLFFSATDENDDEELWVSNGTESGTMRVKDIRTNGSSEPVFLTAVNDKLLFVASNENNDYELWISDGTENGTMLVKNINPNGGSFPNNLTAVGNKLFFMFRDENNDQELWISDGTENGTIRVKDINPNGRDLPGDLIALGDKLFFTATDGNNGIELWMSDGTENGTVLVKDINPNGGSSPEDLTPVGDKLFFAATDENDDEELWVSDGTENGTIRVKDIRTNGSSSPHVLAAGDDQLFFIARNENNDDELWVSDGTESGTIRLEDTELDQRGSSDHFTTFYNNFIFRAGDENDDQELWISHFTENGTMRLKDINPLGSSAPDYLTVVGNTLFFTASIGAAAETLFKLSCCPNNLVETTAPVIGINNSTCNTGQALPSNGSFIPITCPDLSTAEYSINNGDTWNTDLPEYHQSNEMTVLTRCKCETDETIISRDNQVTTEPAECYNPFTLSLSGSTSFSEMTAITNTQTYTINRSISSVGAVSVEFVLKSYGINPAHINDFNNNFFLAQTINFADGETSKTVTLDISTDSEIEKNETFIALIQNISKDGSYGNSYLELTIIDDDAPEVGIAGDDILRSCETTVNLGSFDFEIIPSNGTWNIISGLNGNIENANDYFTTFTGTAGTNYLLEWSDTNGTDQVCISFDGDSDNDGVNDCIDRCPLFDDSIDTDMDGAPDACDCDPNNADDAIVTLPDGTMMSGVIPSDRYESSGVITSTGIIENNSNVTYKAAVSITLNAGFEVESGALFYAFIAPCTFNPDYQIPVFDDNDEVTERFSESETTLLPTTLRVTAQPNPTSNIVQIGYELIQNTPVSMHVFNAMGKQIAMPIQQQTRMAGKHLHGLNVSHLSTGIYYVRVQMRDAQQVVKVMVQR
ncbi:MAG: ELWxxDGT repeat protein, partial [Saprospiraceae bacterium]